MIKSFTVDNFKSLVNFNIRPAGLNLLVGNNNAGKTNICHALRFLGLTAKMSVDDAATECTAEPWNLLNVYLRKDTLNLSITCDLNYQEEAVSFSYELTLAAHKGLRLQNIRTFTVDSEILRISGERFADVVLLENKRGRAKLLHEVRFLKGHSSGAEALYVETMAPVDATMLFRLFDLETNPRSNIFKRYLSSWGYYNLDPTNLRSKHAKANDEFLDSKGTNLSSVLYTLHNVKPRIERKIIEAVRVLEPRLDLLSYQSPDPDHVYMYFEDGKGNKFGVDNISDGTLRYLAICYLITSLREQTSDRAGSPLIIIEEPENGVLSTI